MKNAFSLICLGRKNDHLGRVQLKQGQLHKHANDVDHGLRLFPVGKPGRLRVSK